MNKKMLWSSDYTSEVIEFFKINPNLWDLGNMDYKSSKSSPLMDVLAERLDNLFTGIFILFFN